jgi:hypothetical protein
MSVTRIPNGLPKSAGRPKLRWRKTALPISQIMMTSKSPFHFEAERAAAETASIPSQNQASCARTVSTGVAIVPSGENVVVPAGVV